MADDGFREIQLGKKQLFFLFMAATVSVVVVFLIGVWVGRGVRRADTEMMADAPVADVAPDTQAQPPTQVAPGELDYTARLQTDAAKVEPPPQPESKPIEPPVPVEQGPEPAAKPAAPVTPPVATKSETTPAPKPAAGSVLFQVGAFSTKTPADTLVNRLKKKGYTAFLVVVEGGKTRYRVRVGPFADKAEADRISARLKKEEGLSPLVQR
jgi:cell division septation protein DedD